MGYTRISWYGVAPTPVRQRYLFHAVLFVLTFLSTLMAGTAWAGRDFTAIENWGAGLTYAVLLMTFITAHEFGHYFAARAHGVQATLPYYIPMPLPWLMPFGTLGAVMRTRSPIRTRAALFDIGVSGPLAGFVVCVVYLVIGFLSLPDKEYLYAIHPEYRTLPDIPSYGLTFGDTLLFAALRHFLVPPGAFVPPMNEVYHYPFLCVGWFGLFVTALNLLPVGQLDGGHVLYAMVGKLQHRIGRIVVAVLAIVGSGPFFELLRQLLRGDHPDPLMNTLQQLLLPLLDGIVALVPWAFSGWSGWLVWAILARFLFGISHPPVDDPYPLDRRRMMIGIIAMVIFVISLAPAGIYDVPRPDVGSVVRLATYFPQ
ncbi:MAG: site-2 protease family protein [Bacteroidota bacterium]|nr:site-2 protease family protein [Candidatus Kapabacteria bacterium]MCS7302087.1 site-2 protease family protein [Candidatus Kapabacteria bacterium]MCX7936521.1 site-2 protease family protein [Chlorobiota bacterium]MDW8074682.1 site-2 protease family protein [Bacteroidota bacterium]MDW8270842.1 site-2 protease family protein [Bacteroidota bacterium]